MRINQFLSRAGVASRRKSEAIIKDGLVFVNGKVATELATEIDPTKDQVTVNAKIIKLPNFRYLMLNKPAGYTTTRQDAHAEHTVFELLPNDSSLITVGRLDKATTGLLLFTNDGDFAQKVIHPSKKIEKEYKITLRYQIPDAKYQDLLAGVELEDGTASAKSIQIVTGTEFVMVIEEGRNRIVRRMVQAIGGDVKTLKRTRIGDIILDVPVGKSRDLTEQEVKNYA